MDRAWREWARRWNLQGAAATGVLTVADEIQPVVLIDDVRALNAPPVIKQYAFGMLSVGPVAVQEDILVGAPVRNAINIRWMRVTCGSGVPAYAVNDNVFVADGGGFTSNPIPERLSGPPEIGGFNIAPAPAPNSADTIWSLGTTLALPDQQGNPATMLSNVLTEVDIWVYPGQSFWLRSTGINTVMTVNDLRYFEYPYQGADLLTSMPRGTR